MNTNRLRLLVLTGIASVCWTTTAQAVVWTVPDDAPTIQAAIDLASADDIVEIRAGTYVEYGIELKGDVSVRAITNGTVTVDADGQDRVFRAVDQPGTVTLEGLIIQNGLTAGQGGGIEALNTSIHIIECTIRECRSDYFVGGISVTNGELIITDSTIEDNSAATSAGGVYVSNGLLRMTRCRVLRNGAGSGVGGGVRCMITDVEIRDTVMAENRAIVFGGGEAAYIGGGTCKIVGCTIAANERWSTDAAALYFGSVDVGVVERCIVAFNEERAIQCVESNVEVQCTNVFGNGAGDDVCTIDTGGNFSLDPLFCDVERRPRVELRRQPVLRTIA